MSVCMTVRMCVRVCVRVCVCVSKIRLIIFNIVGDRDCIQQDKTEEGYFVGIVVGIVLVNVVNLRVICAYCVYVYVHVLTVWVYCVLSVYVCVRVLSVCV